MVLAGIDIGSNAARLQITKADVYEDEISFKKLQYIRYPLRLGSDVFSEGKLGAAKINDFVQLMKAFKLMMDLHHVDHYFACATSAMREAQNGRNVVKTIRKECDLEINIITGDEEAEMINHVIQVHLKDENYLHIDVGGGSTELNLYQGKSKVASKSFPIGSVRILNHYDRSESWDDLYDWIERNIGGRQNIVSIGTGGNINKLFVLANGIKGEHIQLTTLRRIQSDLRGMSFDDRVHKLRLSMDRADVIIPASEIYIQVMQHAHSDKMLVPDVGLKDGIIAYLYEKYGSNKDLNVL